jgi:hypothetical protein
MVPVPGYDFGLAASRERTNPLVTICGAVYIN